MRAPWLEADTEFEGVGAHERNPRYQPVDELDAGFTIRDVQALELPAQAAARSFLVQSFAAVAPPRLDGPDIAHYQWDAGPLSLATTRQACTWFAQKCSQSVKYLDPTFARARSQAFALEFRVMGYYHWLSSTTDPEQQAAWYLRNLGALRPGEFAMLDDEESGVDVDKTLAWLEAVEKVTKRPSAVYTGAFVNGGKIWQSPAVREGRYGPRPMILAAYTTEAKAKALPGVAAFPWSSWQFSSNGPVPGITGRCDMNRVDDWSVYDLAAGVTETATGKPTPTPTPTPEEEDEMTPFLYQDQRFANVFVVDTNGAFTVGEKVFKTQSEKLGGLIVDVHDASLVCYMRAANLTMAEMVPNPVAPPGLPAFDPPADLLTHEAIHGELAEWTPTPWDIVIGGQRVAQISPAS